MRFRLSSNWKSKPPGVTTSTAMFGGTSNPKIGFNWTLSQDSGVIVRGDWGTSFRAPGFAEQSAIVGDIISGD